MKTTVDCTKQEVYTCQINQSFQHQPFAFESSLLNYFSAPKLQLICRNMDQTLNKLIFQTVLNLQLLVFQHSLSYVLHNLFSMIPSFIFESSVK